MTKKEKETWTEVRDALVEAYLILDGEAPQEKHRTAAWREGMCVKALARDVCSYAGRAQKDRRSWQQGCKEAASALDKLRASKRRFREVPTMLVEALREFRFGLHTSLNGLKTMVGVVTGKPVEKLEAPVVPFMWRR